MPKFKSNADYQQDRVESSPDHLISKLAKAVEEYAVEVDGDPPSDSGYASAVRDCLTDLRHICDIHGLDFGDLDDHAYQGYLEELEYRKEEPCPNTP